MTTVARELPVLIVGAGPTGLTLACELARRGVGFRLIEAAEGPRPGSRGKGLQPRTLEVFDDLGVIDDVLAAGRMAMPTRSTAPDGTVTRSGGEMPDPDPTIPYPAIVMTPQWRVEEALRRRLAELGGEVEFGTTLDGFEQTPDHVSVVVTTEGRTETVTARWLVGCDGGHSTVRKRAGIPFTGETRDEVRMIVADVEVSGLDRDAWHVWQHADGLLALCPLPSTDVFQYQAVVTPGQDVDLGLAAMRATLEQRTGRTDIRLLRSQWTSLWRANIRLADRYREGRVLLAGDAAHIHSPAGGQGMNTGIQDAHNLGWKLAADAPPTLVDTYEAERRPIAANVLSLSNTLLQQAIDRKTIPIRRDTTTTQLGVNYRDSTLAHDDRSTSVALRAGDRAPDATNLGTTQGERRLFDLTRGGHFTLLCFGPHTAPTGVRTLHVVKEPTNPNDIADNQHHLTNAYNATPTTLVLIRPDGYIGLISDTGDVSRVPRYLTEHVGPLTDHSLAV